jgi:hypothetical protein
VCCRLHAFVMTLKREKGVLQVAGPETSHASLLDDSLRRAFAPGWSLSLDRQVPPRVAGAATYGVAGRNIAPATARTQTRGNRVGGANVVDRRPARAWSEQKMADEDMLREHH